MTHQPDAENSELLCIHLEKGEQSALYALVNDRLNRVMAERVGTPDDGSCARPADTGKHLGHTATAPAVSIAEVLRVLVQDLLYQAEAMTDDDLLVKFCPEFAISQGILTTREALREGVIVLTKEHIIERHVAPEELTTEQLLHAGFSEGEVFELLGRG